MESLVRYLALQQTCVEHMLQAGCPTEAQLRGYVSSLSDTLCSKALLQAPADVKSICFSGLRIMGMIAIIFHYCKPRDAYFKIIASRLGSSTAGAVARCRT